VLIQSSRALDPTLIWGLNLKLGTRTQLHQLPLDGTGFDLLAVMQGHFWQGNLRLQHRVRDARHRAQQMPQARRWPSMRAHVVARLWAPRSSMVRSWYAHLCHHVDRAFEG
jgi:hypothetical protein